MDWRFFIVPLLSLAWPGAHALTVNIPKDSYEVGRGGNITLPCTFVPKAKPPSVIITWTSQADTANAEENIILTHYSYDSSTDVVPAYKGRAELDVDIASGKADLKLSSTTLVDNKVFGCRVQIPRDDEGKLADTARLVVLVAPSVPVCDIQGQAQYGQDINLSCKCAEGSPPPTYRWEERNVQNMPRAKDPRTTDKDGILSLYNISKDTSGYFICTATNKIGSAQCNITLAVMPPSMSLGSTGTTVGIVGAIIGLIAIIVIIYCCCCRKKKQDVEYEMGVHNEEYHDKAEVKDGENRQPDGEEDSAEHRDRYAEGSERNYGNRRRDEDDDNRDRRSDYNDRDSDYKDRRRDYNDRDSDYNDRRSDYNDRRRDYNDRDGDYNDRRRDYNDRDSDYNRRRDYNDRDSDYNDRHRDYNDRDSDHNDRRSDHNDRRRDYDDRGKNYDDRRDRYNDSSNRRDDEAGRERRNDDRRYDEPYNDRESDRPRVPALKPPKKD